MCSCNKKTYFEWLKVLINISIEIHIFLIIYEKETAYENKIPSPREKVLTLGEYGWNSDENKTNSGKIRNP